MGFADNNVIKHKSIPKGMMCKGPRKTVSMAPSRTSHLTCRVPGLTLGEVRAGQRLRPQRISVPEWGKISCTPVGASGTAAIRPQAARLWPRPWLGKGQVFPLPQGLWENPQGFWEA
jgi:hypothetical protein